MADWKRRHATSLKRRRTRDVKPLRWTVVLRNIAWPIGEEAVLELLVDVLQWAPIFAMTACCTLLTTVAYMNGFFIHTSLDPALLSRLVAPITMTVLVFTLALAFHKFGTFYRTQHI
jgi:hypothetical protein